MEKFFALLFSVLRLNLVSIFYSISDFIMINSVFNAFFNEHAQVALQRKRTTIIYSTSVKALYRAKRHAELFQVQTNLPCAVSDV
jgi:hypothetical protein